VQTNVGDLRWRGYLVWVRVFPFRLACSREGYPPRHHPVQLDRASRPQILWRLPTPGGRRSRLTLPPLVYCCGISSEDSIHNLLARVVLDGV
jgi:hypothetical protein